MVEAAVFLGAVIIAATQFVKFLAPNVNGAWTVLVAAGLGLLLALVDKEIGVTDITVAQGILLGLAAVGVHSTARQIG